LACGSLLSYFATRSVIPLFYQVHTDAMDVESGIEARSVEVLAPQPVDDLPGAFPGNRNRKNREGPEFGIGHVMMPAAYTYHVR